MTEARLSWSDCRSANIARIRSIPVAIACLSCSEGKEGELERASMPLEPMSSCIIGSRCRSSACDVPHSLRCVQRVGDFT